MIANGTVLQNRYLIERQIGAGGMGAVYTAVDQKFDSRVAIKETFYHDHEIGGAFEREAKLLNSLHHPVLPHVSDHFVEGAGHFLVMEFIEGEDLSEALKRKQQFAVADVLKWADELLDALDYLHSQSPPIIHRDIKPQNLKLTLRGNIILLDFGLAKLETNDTLNEKSIFGYSRKYSPLEQIQGTGTDQRTDIFALGATIFHLLVGKTPVDVLTRAAAIVAGKTDPLQPATDLRADVPAAVSAVLNTALALNADHRFASAEEMRRALHAARQSDLTVNEAEKIIAEDNQEVTMDAALASFAATRQQAAAQPQDALTTHVEPSQISVKVASAAPVAANTIANAGQTQVTAVSTNSAKRKTVQTNRRSSRRLVAIAGAALLLLAGGLTTFYFANRAGLPAPATETEAAAPPPETIAPQPAPTIESKARIAVPQTVPTASTVAVTTKTIETPREDRAAKRTNQSKEDVAPPRQTIAEDKEPTAKPTTKSESPAPKQPRPAATPNTARAAPRETRVTNEPPPISSIERVLTGDGADDRATRRPRRVRQQRTPEEQEELRRRRTEEVLRRNRQPNP